jgi:LuxR family maltose regulon positive regulatory protein
LQAVALDATGKRGPARSALREGLALGAPGGYIWRWLDAGPGLAPLLRDVRDEGNPPRALQPYLDSLLDACRSAFGDVALQPADEMLDPLTARELEIVRLICAGHSGPEIARELVIAYNTVRKHTSNIYSKLGVSSRAQAIARVNELNLL